MPLSIQTLVVVDRSINADPLSSVVDCAFHDTSAWDYLSLLNKQFCHEEIVALAIFDERKVFVSMSYASRWFIFATVELLNECTPATNNLQ